MLPLVLAAGIWAAFGMLERRVSRPLLAVGLLRRRAVLAGSFLMLAATGLLVGGFFVASFALQHAHHYSALHVGLAFLPNGDLRSELFGKEGRHYPDTDTMSRLYTIKAYDAATQRVMNRLWTRVKTGR